MKFILGRKLGMTQMHDPKGNLVAVTLVEANPCLITAIRTSEKHGYSAVQIGLLRPPRPKSHPPVQDAFYFQREFRVNTEELSEFKVGSSVDLSWFQEGETVKVRGVSKGKGFQGVVKRWGFKGAPATHGHKHDLRAPGSIGSTFPEKVLKGMKMGGRMGGDQVTAQGLQILKIKPQEGIIALKGAIPGPPGRFLEIRTGKE